MEEEDLNENKKVTSIFKKKEVWIFLFIGILIGGILTYLLGLNSIIGLSKNDTIATVKNGKISEIELYQEMKKTYPVDYVLDLVDKAILDKKYKLTDEQNQEIEDQVDQILTQYQNYGYTEEQFLSGNGFESRDDFKTYLELDYKRNLYLIDYFKTLIPQENIENYYNENVYGEINTKHILVQVTDSVTDEDAKKLASEIIEKLNGGANFDDVAKEYGDKVIFEELGYNGFNSSLVTEYVEASKTLENGTYSKEPVKTSYGYHVIYRIDQKEKPTFEEAQNDIVEILAQDLEAEDQYIRYKALIKLREDNKLEFKDDKYKQEYQEYCDQVNSSEE